MQYKTIVLELLEQRPAIYGQLQSQRKLLPALERYAAELKASHEGWREQLSQQRQDAGASQIESVAMELALEELVRSLSSETQEAGELSLDGAIAFIRRTPKQG